MESPKSDEVKLAGWRLMEGLETHGSVAAQVQTVSSLVEFLLAGGRSVFVLVRPSSD